jgi:hypothetical protein
VGEPPLEEGWYLMSTADLEAELTRWRAESPPRAPSNARRLSIDEAVAYRNAGNLPDRHGRTLRLVLFNDRPGVPGAIEQRRLRYEPDFHAAPQWRRAGSVPVNVIPLSVGPKRSRPERWEDDPEIGALEREHAATGRAGGLKIPGDLRGFVFKTIVALRRAGIEVTVDTVSDSVARWLPPDDADRLRAALVEANRA